jgi:thiopurine S-methyltransferase
MLDDKYWSVRYQEKTDSWDIVDVSTPLKNIIDSISNKDLKILIPGCGNAYEAIYALKKGFKNIFVLDYAIEPLENFAHRNPDFPKEQMILGDFFKHEAKYDILLEQTFFCALDPILRIDYVKKCHELLNEKGSIQGVLFNCEFEKEGPPFGGNINEYQKLFEPYFIIKKMDICTDSIAPRMGREITIYLEKK